MTTVAQAINECRTDYLMTGAREQRNQLGNSMTSSTSAMPLRYELKGIKEGAKVSVDTEDMYVWSVVDGSMVAQVERGDFGSTAASHENGRTVYVNPRFSNAQILRAMNKELQALSSPSNGLFRIITKDITQNPVKEGYNIPTPVTDLLSVWQVRHRMIGPEVDWPIMPRNLWEYVRDAPTTDFASGQAFFVRGYVDPAQTIRVWFRSKFSATLATASDDIETVSGLPAEAVDLLILGAGIRLISGREIRRNFDEKQGDTRRADEVPMGANLQSIRGLLELRRTRVREEASRLARLYADRW